jgi:hypothetical protein
MFMLYLIPYLSLLGAFVAWLHITFMGRTSGGVHNAITVGNAYTLRSIAYFLLVTETLPPVSDQEPAANRAAPAAPKQLAASGTPKPKPAARGKRAAKKPATKKRSAKRKPSAGRS